MRGLDRTVQLRDLPVSHSDLAHRYDSDATIPSTGPATGDLRVTCRKTGHWAPRLRDTVATLARRWALRRSQRRCAAKWPTHMRHSSIECQASALARCSDAARHRVHDTVRSRYETPSLRRELARVLLAYSRLRACSARNPPGVIAGGSGCTLAAESSGKPPQRLRHRWRQTAPQRP